MSQGPRMGYMEKKGPGPGEYFTPVEKDHSLTWAPCYSLISTPDRIIIII